MGIEFELKYRATPALLQQIDLFAEGERTLYKMQTTYYDTEDGALSARFYTLRCRMENETAVCTLKAPTEGKGRGEWEINCDNIMAAIPELCKLGAPEDLQKLTAGGVTPICAARFTRIAKTVILPDCTVEVALDEGSLLGGGKEIPLCEVEVEHKSGSLESCELYARQLALLFELKPEKKSKFRRALALYKGE